jgi:hypothetical protein
MSTAKSIYDDTIHLNLRDRLLTANEGQRLSALERQPVRLLSYGVLFADAEMLAKYPVASAQQ